MARSSPFSITVFVLLFYIIAQLEDQPFIISVIWEAALVLPFPDTSYLSGGCRVAADGLSANKCMSTGACGSTGLHS